MAEIVTVNAFTYPDQFNPSVSRTRNIGVNQIIEVDDVTIAAQPAIHSVIKTPFGTIYANETASTIVTAANA